MYENTEIKHFGKPNYNKKNLVICMEQTKQIKTKEQFEMFQSSMLRTVEKQILLIYLFTRNIIC